MIVFKTNLKLEKVGNTNTETSERKFKKNEKSYKRKKKMALLE